MTEPAELAFRWLTPGRWPDLVRLFGERGACGGCWCMAWRLEPRNWREGKGGGNRRALRRLVEGGKRPGILAYLGKEPVAWCAIAPRREYRYLARSRILAPIDDRPVWSVSCLFVHKSHRRGGISARLLAAAAGMAARRGARTIEGYPTSPTMARTPDPFLWTGVPSAFTRAGFRMAARRSRTRPIMRREIAPPRARGAAPRSPRRKPPRKPLRGSGR